MGNCKSYLLTRFDMSLCMASLLYFSSWLVMLVQFVLNVVVLSDICFSVLIQLIESYELLCVCAVQIS